MSMYGFPFASLNGDRKYGTAIWQKFFSKLISNGVILDTATSFQVVPKSGMVVTLKQGYAYANGVFMYTDADIDFTIANASGSARDDVIVLKADYTNRNPVAAVKQNCAKVGSVYTLQRDGSAYELAVSVVHLQSNSVAVTAQMIEDLRADNNHCGVVAGLIQQLDLTALQDQYTAAFNTWFQGIQDIFSANQETNLLNLINLCLALDGSRAITGDINFGDHKILLKTAAGVLQADIQQQATGLLIKAYDAAGANPKTLEIKNDGTFKFNGKKVWTENNFYSGVGEPSGGVDGDVYLQEI